MTEEKTAWQIEAERIKRDAVAYLAEHGITFAATFEPLSLALARGRDFGDGRPCINWRVVIGNGRASAMFDYSQGVGHLPDMRKIGDPLTTSEKLERERNACETGKAATWRSALGWRSFVALQPPTTAEVLQCLCSDAEVLDAGGFEAWADGYGMDTDSIKARTCYDACVESAVKLRSVLGAAHVEAIRNIVSDL